ncbi:hypothetical protein ACFO4E_17900 [Nocardiopsis mangrovi]|uniref:ATP-binding protein n=1 Tax=Nocardiopsis mangrovi TaxID=1179818 RepID=A0ABV9DZJ3_9ACTN
MFQFVRTSTKAVLVAAGTAGFVALGAGIAGADALGVSDALAPQASVPASTGLPDVVGGAQSLVRGVETPNLGTTLPAPDTQNLSGPGGDMSHVSPFLQDRIDGAQGAVDGTRSELGLSDVEHQSAQGEIAGLLPEAPDAGLVPLAEGLPDPLGKTPEATRILLPRVAGEAGDAAGTVTGSLTSGVADGVSEGVSSHLEEHQPDTRVTVHGLDTTELPVIGGAPQVDESVDTVGQSQPAAVPAQPDLAGELSAIDTEAATADVVRGVASGAGATGVLDVVNGIGTPAL